MEMYLFSLIKLSNVTRKPVFGVCDQLRLKPAQLMRLARVLKLRLKQVEILFYAGSEQQRCRSDCADAQADLHLVVCIWHKQVFS